MKRMRIALDAERCEGHGRCYDLAPGLIQPDDEGRAALVEASGQLGPDDEAIAAAAVRNCPERALSIEH